MKDGALKACVAMVCGVAVYGIYLFSNAIAGTPVPDGTLFLGLLAYMGSLSGVVVVLPFLSKPKG